MKKGLILVFGFMVVILMSGCDNSSKNQPNNSENQPVVEPVVVINSASLDKIYGKTSLGLDDLNVIDELLFPVSYSYEAYKVEDWSISDTGEYVYPDWIDHKLLLPIHESMVSREIYSSSVEDWFIYTKARLVLDGGETVSVVYINDVKTLQYAFASVSNDDETILYTFSYEEI